jgi:hypothetical protein
MASLKNTRHEAFAQALTKGMSATAAYESAGYKRNEGSAGRLHRNAQVRARLAELQQRAADATVTNVEDIVRQLQADHALAHRQGQPAAAVSATMGIAKVLGLIVDKRELSGGLMLTHEEALAQLDDPR